MAMKHDDRETVERKVSSLSDDTLAPLSRTAGSAGRRGKNKRERALPGKRRFSWRGLAVDLVLLLLIAGVGVGLWYGYGAVKEMYAPAWETRQVEFCVEIRNLDYDRADQLLPALSGHDIWYSSAADGDRLGTVSDVRAVPSVTEDGRETMTLYLTVSTQAEYRKGQGYYVGTTRLLAGESGEFRAEGLAAEGTLVSLQDLSEVTA